MKKRYFILGLCMTLFIISAAGAYAYFTDKKDIVLKVESGNVGITVNGEKFKGKDTTAIQNMLPGDSEILEYTVQNDSSVDAKVFSEITLKTNVHLSDQVEWFLTNNAEKELIKGETNADGSMTEQTKAALDSGKLVLIEKEDTDDGSTIVFAIDHGKMTPKQSVTTSFNLVMSASANNSFINKVCSVSADVYAIQDEYTDGLSWEEMKAFAIET